MVASHGPQGVGLAGPAPAVHHDGGPAAVVVALAAFEPAEVAGARQPLGAVLAHGHQLPVPDGLPSPFDQHERLGHQAVQDVDHLVGVEVAEPADGFNGIKIESAREGGQPSPQLPSASEHSS